MKKFSTYLFGFSKTDKAIKEALNKEEGTKLYRHNIEIKSLLDTDVIQLVLYKSTNTEISSFSALCTAAGTRVYTCGGYHLSGLVAIPVNGLACDTENSQIKFYYPGFEDSAVVLKYDVINQSSIKSITDTVTEV